MTIRVTRVGDEIVVSVPKNIAETLGIGEGSMLEATATENGIELRPSGAQQDFVKAYTETIDYFTPLYRKLAE
ncbi:MAG: AbrB/MazE/SpoVT family DNA-binding domain-containing protein [Pseudomonadota bacterium]